MRLREKEVHRQDLYHDPHAINNVVLPPDAVERDGVDVRVEEHGGAHAELLDGYSLRALLEGKEFD